MMTIINNRHTLVALTCIALTACKTTDLEKTTYTPSYLAQNAETEVQGAELVEPSKQTDAQVEQAELRFIPPFKIEQNTNAKADDVLNQFATTESLTITADELPLSAFLHLVFGEKLKLSYILGEAVKSDSQTVTLNLQKPISARKLFTLTEDILSQRDYVIRYDNEIFYIHKNTVGNGQREFAYGYGQNESDIPNTSLEIIQMVPFKYGVQISLANTIKQLLGVDVRYDQSTGSLTVKGKRKDIVRALELVRLMDKPTMTDRQIGLFQTTYMPTSDLISKLSELLAQESISLGNSKSTKTTLSAVEIENQGQIFFFAQSMDVIERAVFWAKQIDKPVLTSEKQYFIYAPKYSRAADLGESLEALIGSGFGIGNRTSAATENSKVSSQKRSSVRTASSENMKMVVDERANSIIFYTSGAEYQQLLPLIKRLDVLPKQVILEVMIAEVTLTDEFKQGVEFAFSDGAYGVSTRGAFLGEGFGGLSYLFQSGNTEVVVNLLQTNSLVNILSRPSLVVRDGVSARINVGTDIPIIGETSSDPINGDKQTTKIDYRKTGVELQVTPTVNAQGVVLMEIKQKISNEVEAGSTVAGSPSVFERSIDTEVIAQSGQTVILGGLISENRSQKQSQVPLLGDIPIVGNLFKANTDSGDKTELVVLVTPRVIESADAWFDIKQIFNTELQNLTFN